MFTAIACLLGLTALLSFANDRWLRLQSDIGLLVLAVALTVTARIAESFVPTGAIDALRALTQSFNLNDALLKGVLCFMLFQGGAKVRWANLREQRWLVLSLAFFGTVIACFVTGGLAYAALSAFGVAITLAQALLFGALIAATDPIAAIAILSQIGLPQNLETVVDGESLLNDGVAVVLFTIFAAMAIEGAEPSAHEAAAIFVREVAGGAAVGAVGWLLIHTMLRRAGSHLTGLLVTLGAVSCLYVAAMRLEVSGPIAAVVAGLLTGNLTSPRLDGALAAPVRTFWSGLDDLFNACLFVFVGLHVVLINPLTNVTPGVPALAAITAVLIGRAAAVFPIVSALDAARLIRSDRVGLTKLLTWGGLRGGLSLALAVSLPDAPWKPLMLNMTFAVVLFSIVLQGLTIGRLFTKEKLERLLTS